MPEGNILSKRPKIRSAFTVVVLDDGEAEILDETNIEGTIYYNNLNETYRTVCDIKNQIEIIRMSNLFNTNDYDVFLGEDE